MLNQRLKAVELENQALKARLGIYEEHCVCGFLNN